MASGILGQAKPGSATTTTLYTVPASTVTSFSISAVAIGAPDNVQIAITTTASAGNPNDYEYIEYNTTISSNGVLERTGIVADADKNIVVYSASGNVAFSVYGIEGDA